MGDRLAELRRQRALISEHLTWLDREIERLQRSPSPIAAAAATQGPVVPRDDGSRPLTSPPITSAGSASVAVPSAALPSEIADAEANRLLDEYRSTDASLKNDVRKGCFLYFIGAFVLLALGVTVLYFTIGSR